MFTGLIINPFPVPPVVPYIQWLVTLALYKCYRIAVLKPMQFNMYLQVKAEELWRWPDEWITTVIKTHEQEKNRNVWNGKTETSPSISLERALLCSKRQERGRRSANSAFLFYFQWKTRHHRNCPPFLCPCFPCWKKKITSTFPANDLLMLFNCWLLWFNLCEVAANIPSILQSFINLPAASSHCPITDTEG